MKLFVTFSEPYVNITKQKKTELDFNGLTEISKKEALKEIASRFPGLKEYLPLQEENSGNQSDTVAIVIINNRVVRNTDNPSLGDNSEIFLLFPLTGG